MSTAFQAAVFAVGSVFGASSYTLGHLQYSGWSGFMSDSRVESLSASRAWAFKILLTVAVATVLGMPGCGQQDDSMAKGQGGTSAFETDENKKKSGAFKMRGVNATGW